MVIARLCCIGSLLLGIATAQAAAPLNFEEFADGAVLDTGYAGLVFANTRILTAGVSLNEFEFPPRSGTNVATDDGGPIVVTFLSPMKSFSAYFTYAVPLVVTAYDAASTPVAQVNSLFAANTALSGDVGSAPNERIELEFASGFMSVRIAGAVDGGSFVMDDLSVAAVPEPGTLALFAVGALVVGGVARQRRPAR